MGTEQICRPSATGQAGVTNEARHFSVHDNTQSPSNFPIVAFNHHTLLATSVRSADINRRFASIDVDDTISRDG